MAVKIGEFFVSQRLYGRADMTSGSVAFPTLAAARAYAARPSRHTPMAIYRRDTNGVGLDKFTRFEIRDTDPETQS